MNLRNAAIGTVLAVVGLGAAVGIGLAANEFSGDSVGLSAEPLSAGETLAPAPAPAADDAGRAERRAEREQGRTDTTRAPTETAPPVAEPPTATVPDEVETEADDDNSGRNGSGDDSPSDDSSGPGSGSEDNSGHGGGGDDD